jgi:hypothetical protein
MTTFLVVDAGGAPLFEGADRLDVNPQYRVFALAGATYDEAAFRAWAANLGAWRHETELKPDSPLEDLVAHCNRVGWRVLQLLGNDEYRVASPEAIASAERVRKTVRAAADLAEGKP